MDDLPHCTRERLLCHSATSPAGISLSAERGPPGRVRPPSDLVGEALLIFSVSLSLQVISPVPPHALSTGKVGELAGAYVLKVQVEGRSSEPGGLRRQVIQTASGFVR